MLLLSAGHYPKEPGACYPMDNRSWCEHEQAVKWMYRIGHYARDYTMVDFVPQVWLGDKVRWINEHNPKADLAVEIHFNSNAGGRSKGSETLYCPRSMKGGLAARIVQEAISSILPPNRGTKEGWYRMDMPGHVDYPGDIEGDEKVDYFLKKTDPVALILEPEFIYNRSTIEAVREVACDVIAKALVDAITAITELDKEQVINNYLAQDEHGI